MGVHRGRGEGDRVGVERTPMEKRLYPPLTPVQKRLIRRLGLTPGHVESCPDFRDGHQKDHWKRTVRALHKRELIVLQMDYAIDELFVRLTRAGLQCAKHLYRETGITPEERDALQRLRQWRTSYHPRPAPVPPPPVCPLPGHEKCPGGTWRCSAQHRAATLEGLARARKLGVHIGRPRAVIPEEQVLALRARGVSLREIAKTVGLGAATVHRFLDGHRRRRLAEEGKDNTGVVYPGTPCESHSSGIPSQAI
jgi:hypothetical protein